MTQYYRYDWINNEMVDKYDSIENLLEETNYFYHNTFDCEEDYDENLEIQTVAEAYNLWEGSGYAILIPACKQSEELLK